MDSTNQNRFLNGDPDSLEAILREATTQAQGIETVRAARLDQDEIRSLVALAVVLSFRKRNEYDPKRAKLMTWILGFVRRLLSPTTRSVPLTYLDPHALDRLYTTDRQFKSESTADDRLQSELRELLAELTDEEYALAETWANAKTAYWTKSADHTTASRGTLRVRLHRIIGKLAKGFRQRGHQTTWASAPPIPAASGSRSTYTYDGSAKNGREQDSDAAPTQLPVASIVTMTFA